MAKKKKVVVGNNITGKNKAAQLKAIGYYVLMRGQKKGGLTENKKWAMDNNKRLMREKYQMKKSGKESRVHRSKKTGNLTAYAKG